MTPELKERDTPELDLKPKIVTLKDSDIIMPTTHKTSEGA